MAYRAKAVSYSAVMSNGQVVTPIYTVPLGVTARIASVQLGASYYLKVNNAGANTDGAISSPGSIDFQSKPFYLAPGDVLSIYAGAAGSPSLLLNVIEEYDRANTDFEALLFAVDGVSDFAAWDAQRSYSLNDPTFYMGVMYKSLVSANQGNPPSTSPTKWQSISGGTVTGDVQETLTANKTYAALTTHHSIVCDNSGAIAVSIAAGAAMPGTRFSLAQKGAGATTLTYRSGVSVAVPPGSVISLLWDGSAWRHGSDELCASEYLNILARSRRLAELPLNGSSFTLPAWANDVILYVHGAGGGGGGGGGGDAIGAYYGGSGGSGGCPSSAVFRITGYAGKTLSISGGVAGSAGTSGTVNNNGGAGGNGSSMTLTLDGQTLATIPGGGGGGGGIRGGGSGTAAAGAAPAVPTFNSPPGVSIIASWQGLAGVAGVAGTTGAAGPSRASYLAGAFYRSDTYSAPSLIAPGSTTPRHDGYTKNIDDARQLTVAYSGSGGAQKAAGGVGSAGNAGTVVIWG